MNTHSDLVRELQKLAPNSVVLEIIRNARAGVYHDFLSDHTFPKHVLVKDLRRAGAFDLVDAVALGTFDDESPDDRLPERGS